MNPSPSRIAAHYPLSYEPPTTFSGATFGGSSSEYRYSLWRCWDPDLLSVKWVLLNPSVANATQDDPTIRKCSKFARAWGYGGIMVVNLFAFRATDPKLLKGRGYAELVGPENNDSVLNALVGPGPNIAAWGQGGKLWGRAEAVHHMIRRRGIKLQALRLAKDGVTPYHPLYLKDDSKPVEF